MRRLSVLAFAFSLVAAVPLEAQRDDSPRRPQLEAGADTNEAAVYFNLGMSLIRREPQKAADAFYWAGELNPASAEAFYARRVALLMSKPHVMRNYMRGDRRIARHKDVQQADSLYLRALKISPFFSPRLDAVFLDAMIRVIAHEAVGPGGDVSRAEYEIRNYYMQAPASVKAWQAHSNGRFEEALRQYALAIKSAKRKANLRIDRGRLFFQLDNADSALTELTLAVEEMRKADEKDLVYVYESKALIEHSIGLVQLRLGNKDAAREAFGRALEEDLSYGPAHAQLGFMAIGVKDTAAAISEFELATQLDPDDALLHYYSGYTLHQFNKSAEAEVALRRAIAINPVYAAPHFVLAQALAAQGRTADASAAYHSFLSLAGQSDPRRDEVRTALAALSGAGQ